MKTQKSTTTQNYVIFQITIDIYHHLTAKMSYKDKKRQDNRQIRRTYKNVLKCNKSVDSLFFLQKNRKYRFKHNVQTK